MDTKNQFNPRGDYSRREWRKKMLRVRRKSRNERKKKKEIAMYWIYETFNTHVYTYMFHIIFKRKHAGDSWRDERDFLLKYWTRKENDLSKV